MDVIEYADNYDYSKYSGERLNGKNNPEFIETFTEWCQDAERVWSFESNENGYCGYTAYISESYNPFSMPRFEFAYSGTGRFVKVFNANNNGYWVPEYIDLEGEEARTLLSTLKTALLKASGF